MKLPYPELARICRGLGMLLGSGIGGADCAFLLAQQEQHPVDELLHKLGQSLDQGMSLAEAMEESDAFPEYVRIMVHIGQETGRLEESLNTLADYYEEQDRIIHQIRNAVAYPAMVMGLILLVVGVLLVEVLPVFDRVYASLGSQLTGLAGGLLYCGQLLKAVLPVLLAILLILAAASAIVWLRPSFRQAMIAAWKRQFADRGILRKFTNARFARALSMGLSSGLTMEHSMALAQKLLQDIPAAASRCGSCTAAMAEGASYGNALEQWELLPAAQCRLLQIGYRSGNVDKVMEQIADTLLEDARNALNRAISAIEPAMVLVSSVLVGLILLSVMLPLVDILTVLG